MQRVALRKLRMLNRAENLNDLRVPPANRLEKLKGERLGQHSIRINDRWRICFKWQDSDAFQVEIVDYRKQHKQCNNQPPQKAHKHRLKRGAITFALYH